MADPTDPVALSRESSLTLLERARAGDDGAMDALLTRYRPRLVRWARHRLRPVSRDLADTDDLVQNTLIKLVRNLEGFHCEGPAGFQQYLRLSIANAIRDEVKKSARRPLWEPVERSLASALPSPLRQMEVQEHLERYETALAQLSPDEQGAIIARFELGFTHDELAAALGKGTPDAARKLCCKAIARLLTIMNAGSRRAS
jgi:RNA polymerase sigma-70 factor (ECF subfamily)